MALRANLICLVATIALTLSTSASAQNSSCTSAIISLAPCLNYITGNGTTPSSSCCTQLASVVKSEPECLCTVLNGGASSLGITVNQTKALALPSACNVTTPPVSKCNNTSALAPSPATPSAATDGSKVVPATGTESSDGTYLQIPVSFVGILISVAAYFTVSPAPLSKFVL